MTLQHRRKVKIVVDENIPFIREALSELADEVVAKAGSEICPADVRDATILVVRTRTRCDRSLLEGSRVRLVVTATIGFDHLDTEYLKSAGIEWYNCPGCNATSVAQYVKNCLLLLQRDRQLDLSRSTMGIIGVGHVGTAVMYAALELGIGQLLLNDPPREANGENPDNGLSWTDFSTLVAESDIISVHTPLITNGSFPTLHLLNHHSFSLMRRRPVIINTGRGGLVDEKALENAMDSLSVGEVIIDTWENEPHVNRSLLYKVYIGTPHIAGYSADGKANATRMTLAAICRFLRRPMSYNIQPPSLPDTFTLNSDPDVLALQLYNPMEDSLRLRAHPEHFEQLRSAYPLRREHL